jgi:hypothetical protein
LETMKCVSKIPSLGAGNSAIWTPLGRGGEDQTYSGTPRHATSQAVTLAG